MMARRTIKPIEEAHLREVRFTADASHELRSPLAALKTEIEVALRDKQLTKEEAVALLASNLEEVERLRNLSENLLSLARDDSNLIVEKIALTDPISKAVATIMPEAEKKKIEIKLKTPKNIFITGNRDYLTQLFTILLDNAVKYSEKEKTVKIIAEKHGNEAIVKVVDQGIGLSKEDQAHIFERFYRVDQSRSKNKTDGYGLGLSIAQKIVENHHGKIEIESTLVKGSTFTVKLPSV